MQILNKETNFNCSNDSLHLLLCEWLQFSSYASLSYATPLSPAMVVKPLGSEAFYCRSLALALRLVIVFFLLEGIFKHQVRLVYFKIQTL
ncbi:unnamed protein product, partial [Brassica oleracea]